jgi:hypothetical protein
MFIDQLKRETNLMSVYRQDQRDINRTDIGGSIRHKDSDASYKKLKVIFCILIIINIALLAITVNQLYTHSEHKAGLRAGETLKGYEAQQNAHKMDRAAQEIDAALIYTNKSVMDIKTDQLNKLDSQSIKPR